MRTVFFDLICGASGDMLLASLLDLGAPLDRLRADIADLRLDTSIGTERAQRSSIDCTHMVFSKAQTGRQPVDHVHGPDTHEHPHGHEHSHDHEHPHGHEHHHAHERRNLSDLLEIINRGGFPARVVERCRRVLTRLGEAEAAVHAIPLDQVHFHEVGAVDTIIDVAGVCLCLEYLGIERVLFGELTDGHGTIRAAHGVLPVPVPAVCRLAQGFRMRQVDVDTELLTPTGCALLTTLGEQVALMPSAIVERVGFGCGDKIIESRPNFIRAVLLSGGDTRQNVDSVCVLESDMDHLSGEIMSFAAQECLAAGALDVSWTPLLMKKGRPGYRLTVLCVPQSREALTDCIMLQTRTLGVRWHLVERTVAQRTQAGVQFGGVDVTEKRCSYKGAEFSKLEFDDLAALSRATRRPLIDLVEEYVRTRTK